MARGSVPLVERARVLAAGLDLDIADPAQARRQLGLG